MNTINWRDRDGNYVPLHSMHTQYLYNTVKCLWNNVFGRTDTFGSVIRWQFDPAVYTAKFLTDVFIHGFTMLEDRKDKSEDAVLFIEHVGNASGSVERIFRCARENTLHELQLDGDPNEYGDN